MEAILSVFEAKMMEATRTVVERARVHCRHFLDQLEQEGVKALNEVETKRVALEAEFQDMQKLHHAQVIRDVVYMLLFQISRRAVYLLAFL